MTEPVAMTVAAMIFAQTFFARAELLAFKYATVAALFVVISIGGSLTPYAAPPIVVVARPWNWGIEATFIKLGMPAILAVFLISLCVTAVFRKDVVTSFQDVPVMKQQEPPLWMMLSHVIFMTLIIAFHAYPAFVTGLFLVFLGWYRVTAEHQSALKLSPALLVAAFLGGLIFLGSFQRWWIEPLMTGAGDLTLYWGSLSLTAIVDNAALTYLASLIPDLPESSKVALVRGALAGGGLTIIANAPNPIGLGILKHYFGEEGLAPLKLLLFAIPPTLIASLCFLAL